MADQEQRSEAESVTNIVLVGRTGNGKSATGNTLLRETQFISRNQAVGVTMKCEAFRTALENGPIINVIDTPGLFDVELDHVLLSKEIIKCLGMAKDGIHAVLFVVSILGRMSKEEEATLNALQRIFEAKILDYFIVVFTGGDKLEEDGVTFDQYWSRGIPEYLKKVLRLCGGRKILLNNKTKDEKKKAEQHKQLLALIADVVKQNGGMPYTDQMHQKIKEENDKLREQERQIESKNLAEAEAAAMKETMRMENEKTMNMMAQMVENTIKVSAEAYQKQIKESAEAHQKQISQLTELLQQGQQRQQVQQRQQEENDKLREQERQIESIKNLAVAEMAAMKETMRMENEKTVSAEAHQERISQLTELLQQGQQRQQAQQVQQRPNLFPIAPGVNLECNIM